MYRTYELARFAFSEFERGLTGLTDEEAQTQLTKADGTEMNAISWVVGHIAGHWLILGAYVGQEHPPSVVSPFAPGPTADPSPPPLSDVLKLLEEAVGSINWIASADDAFMSSTREERAFGDGSLFQRAGLLGGNVGAALMRVILYTWFHIGEVNAIRQMLGHAEIAYVGKDRGKLEWRSASA